jgi:KaiC/GvpD/RAD55 family RecA-like ATPase
MKHDEAAKELGLQVNGAREKFGSRWATPVVRQPPPEAYVKAEGTPPEALKGRGFLPKDMERYGIKNDDGDAIIPVPNKEDPINYKRRKADRDAKPKYTYELEGVGAPAIYYPGNTTTLLIIEGELNALVAHSVMEGEIAVLGVPGASHPIDPALVDDKHVFLYADKDKAGNQAREKWLSLIRQRHFKSVTVLSAQERDFCDIAGQDGREALFNLLTEALGATPPTLTILDRFVSDQHTVGMLQSNAEQFVTGTIVNPTGYHQLDAITFGLPTSGLSLIAALPSSGKSIWLRDVLFHNTQRGKKILLFSPDQSADSIYILLASRRAGVPAWRVQRKMFTQELLLEYGSPEAITKRWKEVFDDTILHYSDRFRISSESEVAEIKKLTEEALADGVTMFGGDYIQIFEPEDASGKEIDGKAIKDLKKEIHRWGVPFILAAQLAKYKFGRNIKRDGIPYASDIEGSGKYFQASEQVYMIFNGEVYWKEYVDQNDPPPQPAGFYNDQGKVRIYVRKNKLGEIGGWVYLRWNKDLLTFENL